MKKLNRQIFVELKATDEVIKDLGYENIADKVIRKKEITFNKFTDNPEYTKEVDVTHKSFNFSSYEDVKERLQFLNKHSIYYVHISDDNEDPFQRKTFGKIFAINENGIQLNSFLDRYIEKEKRVYEVVRTKVGAKNKLKRVHYWGNEI
tara:strand:- start:83 stop:529 length:447 start_codon:yes stop_codon:yes gene_type:complete